MRASARIFLLAAAACLLAAPAAFAEGNYGVVKGGFYTPTSNDLDGFSSGFNGEAAVGHDFTRNLGAEIGVGFFKTDKSVAGVSNKIEVVPVTATFKVKLPIDVVELFAGAGLGAYSAKFKAGGASASDTAFGYHVAAGGAADLTQNLFLGAEFRYLWAKASFDPGGTGSVDRKLDGYTTTLNLGVRF
jgi:opacity protein-like surface antigen